MNPRDPVPCGYEAPVSQTIAHRRRVIDAQHREGRDETSRVARRERRESDLSSTGRSVLDLPPASRRCMCPHFIHSGPGPLSRRRRGAYRRASRTQSDIFSIKDIHGLAITVAAAMPRGRGARYLPTLPVPYLAHKPTKPPPWVPVSRASRVGGGQRDTLGCHIGLACVVRDRGVVLSGSDHFSTTRSHALSPRYLSRIPFPFTLRNAAAREGEGGRSGGPTTTTTRFSRAEGAITSRRDAPGWGGSHPFRIPRRGNRHTRGNARLCRERVVAK